MKNPTQTAGSIAHGEDEARKVGQRLRDIPFAHVLTSPLQRAQQTCALSGLTPVAEIEPDLAEWDYGIDHDLHAGPHPAHPVFRSLARSAGGPSGESQRSS